MEGKVRPPALMVGHGDIMNNNIQSEDYTP